MVMKLSNAFSFVRLHGKGYTHICPVWGDGEIFPYTLCDLSTYRMYKLNADDVWEKYICTKCKEEYIDQIDSAPTRLSEILKISEEDAKHMIKRNKDRLPPTKQDFLEMLEKSVEKNK